MTGIFWDWGIIRGDRKCKEGEYIIYMYEASKDLIYNIQGKGTIKPEFFRQCFLSWHLYTLREEQLEAILSPLGTRLVYERKTESFGLDIS